MYCLGKFRLAVFNTQPPHLYFGGVERRIIETTRRLANEADITVYSGTKAGFKEPIAINNVNFVPCRSTDSSYPLDNWFFNKSIAKKAASIEADIYEAHNVSGYGFPNACEAAHQQAVYPCRARTALADEYRQGIAGTPSPRGRLANFFMRYQARLERQTARKPQRSIAVSNYSKLKKIKRGLPSSEDKIRIVPNGIDTKSSSLPIRLRGGINGSSGLAMNTACFSSAV